MAEFVRQEDVEFEISLPLGAEVMLLVLHVRDGLAVMFDPKLSCEQMDAVYEVLLADRRRRAKPN